MSPVPVTCHECGKDFDSTPSRVKAGRDKYCSRSCYYALNKVRYEGDTAYLLLTTKTREPVAETAIDAADVELAQSLGVRWTAQWVESTKSYRVGADPKSGRVYLHRLLLGAPPEMHVDHLNGDTLHNRRSNLRLCTQAENNQNLHGVRNGAIRKSQSGVRGVWRDNRRGTWCVQITVNYRSIWIGSFDNLADAEQASIAARHKYFTHSEM